MLAVQITIVLVAFGSALGAFVFARAGSRRTGGLFLGVVAMIVTLNALSWLQTQARHAEVGFQLAAISAVTLGLMSLALLLLLSALFAPEWWRGRRPIRLIALPYLLCSLALACDAAAQTKLIVGGVRFVDLSYRLVAARPGGLVMLALFSAGWLVHLALLAAAFRRDRAAHTAIGLLVGAIGVALIVGVLGSQVNLPSSVGLVTQTVPLLVALAYAVLRTNLLTPTGGVLDMTLQSISDAVVALEPSGAVAFANRAAARLGIEAGQPFDAALAQAGLPPTDAAAFMDGPQAARTLTLGGRRFEASRTPIISARGRQIGWLVVGRDVTEAAQREDALEQERAALAATVRQLEDERRGRVRLAEVMRQIAVPVIPVLRGVLVVPLVGELDTARAEEFSAALLGGIERERAHVVMLDVTGVPLLDADGAGHLMRAVRAAELLGARCVLVGVRPEIAQSLVALGADLAGLRVAATLREALAQEVAARHSSPGA